MSRRRTRGGELANRGNFANAVQALYRCAVGIAPKPQYADDLQVRQVAFGLAAIQQLIDQEAKRQLKAPLRDGLTATGLAEAMQIIDALVTGRDHPIQRYVSDLHTAKFRANAAPPSSLERLGRGMVTGAIWALTEKAGFSSEAAARRFVCRHLSGDRPLGEGEVKGWGRRFRETEDPLPKAAGTHLVERAAALPSDIDLEHRIITVAQQMLIQFWITPRLS
jgi:hypothetical protein